MLESGKGRGGSIDIAFGPVILLCTAVRHDDDHLSGLAVGIQVVHDDVGDALEPLALVTSDAMEEVEDGVLLRSIVFRRQVDGRLADGADELGLVLDGLECAAVDVRTLRIKSSGSFHIGIEGHVDLGALAEAAHSARLGVGRTERKRHGGNGQ